MGSGRKFFIPFILSLGIWFGFYELVLKPAKLYDSAVINAISTQSEVLLSFVGEQARSVDTNYSGYTNYVEIIGSPGVTIGPGCDGLVIIALFVIFVLFFPGDKKHKLWYIPVGVVLIHSLNIVRVSALAMIMKFHPDWLEFNHDYTFTVITYGFVFFLWYVWVNKFSS